MLSWNDTVLVVFVFFVNEGTGASFFGVFFEEFQHSPRLQWAVDKTLKFETKNKLHTHY